MTVIDTLTTLTCDPGEPGRHARPVGATVTCTGTYVVTQADIDNNGNPNPDGFIHNAATGDSDDTELQDSSTDTPTAGSATSSTIKTVESVKNADDTTDADGTIDTAGDKINYKVTFTQHRHQDAAQRDGDRHAHDAHLHPGESRRPRSRPAARSPAPAPTW